MTLPKIPIGTYIGDLAREYIPHGDIVVDAVKTGIQVVRNTDLNLGHVVSDAGQAAIDAAKARVKEDIAQATRDSAAKTVNLASFFPQNDALVPILIGVVLLVLLTRGGRK